MPPTVLYLNDVDLAALGLWVTQPPGGWLSAPSVSDRPISVPGHAGGILTATEAVIGSRTIEVAGTLIGTSVQDAHDQWDRAKRLLDSPVLEVRFASWPDRVGYGRAQNVPTDPVRGIESGFRFRFTILLPNPYLLARAVDVYTLTAGIRVVPTLGTAACAPRIILIGTGALLPTVTYLDGQGIVQGAHTFDLGDGVVMPAGEWIEVDEMQGMTRHTVAGVVSNAALFWDPSSVPFVMDPQDGDGTVGPSLVATNCVAVAHIRKAWR
jgi:hypothetical protein